MLRLVLHFNEVGGALHDHGAVLAFGSLERLLQLVDAALLIRRRVAARPQCPVHGRPYDPSLVQVGQVLHVLSILQGMSSFVILAFFPQQGSLLLFSVLSPDRFKFRLHINRVDIAIDLVVDKVREEVSGWSDLLRLKFRREGRLGEAHARFGQPRLDLHRVNHRLALCLLRCVFHQVLIHLVSVHLLLYRGQLRSHQDLLLDLGQALLDEHVVQIGELHLFVLVQQDVLLLNLV